MKYRNNKQQRPQPKPYQIEFNYAPSAEDNQTVKMVTFKAEVDLEAEAKDLIESDADTIGEGRRFLFATYRKHHQAGGDGSKEKYSSNRTWTHMPARQRVS